jgi:hypothetical protein
VAHVHMHRHVRLLWSRNTLTVFTCIRHEELLVI